MENPIFEIKKELIEWIKNLDELEMMEELLDLKNSENSVSIVSDLKKEYGVKDDFDERFAKGISATEMRGRTMEHINNLPWK